MLWKPLRLASALLGAIIASAILAPHDAKAEPVAGVVVTSKPIHSLVAGVMAGEGSPRLLVKGSQSPHTYSLKPSDAAALNHARVVFRVSDVIEPFTRRIFQTLPSGVQRSSLATAPGVVRLPARSGGTFEVHGHDHGHSHGHEGRNVGHEVASGEAYDGHVWLDPRNARAMTAEIAKVLSRAFPSRAAQFQANATALALRLEALDRELATSLAGVRGRPFVVFHDAFQYLEHRYELAAAGAVVMAPDVPPSGRRLIDIRRRIAALGAKCVFAEPQYPKRLLVAVTEGLGARTGQLDPEALSISPGVDLYATMMRGIAASIVSCLAPA